LAFRSALHRAGAAALSELLRFPVPARERGSLPCPCGQRADYQELRSGAVLTALGWVQMWRPYYLCPHCHSGQFPVDVELDVLNTEFSPGVRRMLALVGQEMPFRQGREQMKLRADLEVTAKSVERTAEALGADIGQRQQAQIQQALELNLPAPENQPIPILYVQMDGTGVPVVKKETDPRMNSGTCLLPATESRASSSETRRRFTMVNSRPTDGGWPTPRRSPVGQKCM